MDTSSYIFIAVLGPFTFAAMLSTTIYMKVQAKKLSTEIQKRGLVVYTFPIFVTGEPTNLNRVPFEPRPPLISPFAGIPPPPPYSRGAPPTYNNSETGNSERPPPYEMTQAQTVIEMDRSTQTNR